MGRQRQAPAGKRRSGVATGEFNRMAVNPDILTEIVQQLSPLGAISAKPMFGGFGIFVEGKMFMKISPANVIAFKADDHNRQVFVDAGMKKSGKMPYFEASAEQLEDNEAFMAAARTARDAALR